MIRIKGLSHRIGGTEVLRGINLEIPAGGMTALIGPNGAGKSTLLSLIARLIPVQAGRVMVDDLQVGACADDVLARRLAILPQSSDVALRLTVRELVGFGRYPHHKGRPSAADHAKVAEVLTQFDLAEMAARSLETLSGGQRQRALVAMVAAQDTDYVLLDEPLNNLDIAAAQGLMRLLRALRDAQGKTVVIVLHDINFASAYADHLVTLKAGRLGPVGRPAEVISSALLRDLFGAEAPVHVLDGRPFVTPE